jgi:hypothetical protein
MRTGYSRRGPGNGLGKKPLGRECLSLLLRGTLKRVTEGTEWRSLATREIMLSGWEV